MPRSLDFKHILTARGIESQKRIVLDDAGIITGIEPAPGPDYDGWFALPGMPNAHSHAFQRAMVGQAEAATGEDSFWSWREYMYGLASLIDPDDLYAIARRAFADMLRAGFTSVGEFHYLHHLPDGGRSTAMGQAVIGAARDVGLRLVWLPVYYKQGGFGQPARAFQQRFIHESVTAFADYLARFAGEAGGIAPHSLRAVPVEELNALLAATETVLGPACPVHIHIAEQRAEVEECIARHGATPVRLLHDTVGLDARWSLVHATHTDAGERRLMLEKMTSVVLCPLTEAYLGDGIFEARDYMEGGGTFAVGSDSNIRIDAIEELRFAEYGQRLKSQRRARLATAKGLGGVLWDRCARAGARALGLEGGAIEPGRVADLVVLDSASSPVAGVAPGLVPDAWITGGSRENICSVYVAGERRVTGGCVAGEAAIASGFARCLKSLGRRMADKAG